LRALKLIGGGRALGHANGMTWMIRGALPGELLLARPTRLRKRVVEADTVEILADPHPARLDQVCPQAGRCGGCDWVQVEAEGGAELKRDVASEAAARFPEIASRIRAAPVKTSRPAYRLRNRLHWDPQRSALGFYEPLSWRVADVTPCRIIAPALTAVLPQLAIGLDTSCPEPVDIETILGDDGLVAALRPARRGPKTIPPAWIPTSTQCPGLEGFHVLASASDVEHVWGRDRVSMALPIPLQVPVGAFFQGNRHLIPWLFDTVSTLIGAGSEPVFDLHGGVGFLAAAGQWAGRDELTISEINTAAAAAARRNLPRANVVAATAESFVRDRPELPARSVVITDPPRTGMTPVLRRHLTRWRPERIVMLGCDPATWARDADELLNSGYTLSHIELVDLFPFTHHVEILAVLETV